MAEQITVFDPSKVIIITSTFEPNWVPGPLNWQIGEPVTPKVVDKVRGDLALQTALEASLVGTRLILIDGGASNHPFRESLTRISGSVLVFDEADHGMSASRQQGFRIAQTFPESVNEWIEPQKVGMANVECLKPVALPLVRREADLVIPGRDKEGFATLNNYQADMEQESNLKWKELLIAEGILPVGHPGFDNWFGPRAWHQDIAGLFLRKYKSTDTDATLVRPEQYGNALQFPLITALFEGISVLSVEVPFRYPETQQAIEQYNPEFEAKRRDQQLSILETIREFIAFLHGERSRLALTA